MRACLRACMHLCMRNEDDALYIHHYYACIYYVQHAYIIQAYCHCVNPRNKWIYINKMR